MQLALMFFSITSCKQPFPNGSSNAHLFRRVQMEVNRHNRPIASRFHSGRLEFSYLGQDLDEADGESEETIAGITVRERTAEHLHDVLSGD